MPVCIAGMHRSGTSMVARLLSLCGLYLGDEKDLHGPGPANPEGFWENWQFVNLNDEILKCLGVGWDLPFDAPAGWESSSQVAPLRDAAVALTERFRYSGPWGWKDPRNSLTFPFWRALLPELRLVVCLRNPVEVAESLRVRGSSSMQFGFNLWLSYYRQLLVTCCPQERVITHYDSYFDDCQQELRRITSFLEMDVPDDVIERACVTVKKGPRQRVTTMEGLSKAKVPSEALRLYEELCAEAGPVYQAGLQCKMAGGTASPSAPISEPCGHSNASSVTPPQTPAPSKEQAAGPINASASGQLDNARQETVADVSVIIVNYNGCEYLEPCLSSLGTIDYPNAHLEIIVVDNGSTDGSVDLLKRMFPHVRLIQNHTNLGFSKAANIGAAAARGEFRAFLNNDMRVDKGWLRPLLGAILSDSAVACAGSVILNWEGTAPDFIGRPDDAFCLDYRPSAFPSPLSMVGPDTFALFVSGGATMIRSEVFKELGGFDPDFFLYHEDVDLGWRLWLRGYKCVLSSESIAYHRGGASSSKLPPEYIQGLSQKHTLFSVFKNLDDSNLRTFLPLLLFFFLDRGRWAPAAQRSLAMAIQEFQYALDSLISKRAEVQKTRVRSDAEIFSLLGHPFSFLLHQPDYECIHNELQEGCSRVAFDPNDANISRTAITEWLNTAHVLHERHLLAEIHKKEQEGVALGQAMAAKEQAVQGLSAQVVERDAAVAALRAQVAAKEEALRVVTEQIAAREQVCSNPIFIIGSPRSGTSILAWSLAQHSQLWTSSESDILLYLFGDDCLDIAFQTAKERSGSWLQEQGVERAEFLRFLGLGANALFTSRSQGRRWIDQTPGYTYMLDVLVDMFPDAFFIHILRDGRRVVNSMINSHFDVPWATDFRQACQTWRQCVENLMDFCTRYPTRCLTVVNESLIKEPQKLFAEVFRFIRVPDEDRPVDFFRSNRINSSYQRDFGETSSVQKLSEPWNEWTLEQKKVFLEEAGYMLIKCGFATEGELKRFGRLDDLGLEEGLLRRELGVSPHKPPKPRVTIRELKAQLVEQTDWAQRMAEKVAEREQAVGTLQAQVATKEQTIRVVSEQIATKDAHIERITSTLGWRLLSYFGPIKYRLLLPLYRLLKSSLPKSPLLPSTVATSEGSGQITSTLLSAPEEQQPHPRPSSFDIIMFPIIDWEFRFQRPQQIAVRFARAGHRVFYARTRFTEQQNPITRSIHERVFEVQLPGQSRINLYSHAMDERLETMLSEAFASLRQEFGIVEAVCFVNLPFWRPIALRLRKRFGWKIVYDCMDYHRGFSNTAEQMLKEEEGLSRVSDLVLTSSRPLFTAQSEHNSNCILVPNATDFEHFNSTPHPLPGELSTLVKPIIGYYGAISDWFDCELIHELALARPQWSFVLIGCTFGANLAPLRHVTNVHLLGEKPYPILPPYLHAFDICVIPFKKTPLTDMTNPVKLFEFLSAGKAVVATDLTELRHYTDYMDLASTSEQWLLAIEKALQDYSPERVAARVEFARHNTWDGRFTLITQHIIPLYPKVSIIIVTHNNLDYTRLCLESIYRKTVYPNYEVIVVDNASIDGTGEFLKTFVATHPNLVPIFNEVNEGFAHANNRGIVAATGEYVVFLNNDTIVTRGWLSGLINHLRDVQVGMVGPVTNCSGNESRIEVDYRTSDEIESFAERYTHAHEGQTFDISMLALFCIAMRRSVLNEVGLLDERFGVGMFEDDDYALRIKQKGYKVMCAEDVFVHHWGSASFSKLHQDEYRRLFDENRRKFEEKWGMQWEPHRYRSGLRE